jgi:hypothetical protein
MMIKPDLSQELDKNPVWRNDGYLALQVGKFARLLKDTEEAHSALPEEVIAAAVTVIIRIANVHGIVPPSVVQLPNEHARLRDKPNRELAVYLKKLSDELIRHSIGKPVNTLESCVRDAIAVMNVVLIKQSPDSVLGIVTDEWQTRFASRLRRRPVGLPWFKTE